MIILLFSSAESSYRVRLLFSSSYLVCKLNFEHSSRLCRFGLDNNDRSGFSEIQIFIPLLDIRKICKVEEIGYVRKPRRLWEQARKCETFKIYTKVIPIIVKSQFPWSKNSIAVLFGTGVRGGRGTSKFALTPANFPSTLTTYDFALSYLTLSFT